MKKNFTLLMLMACSIYASAQGIVNIPDPNFKAYLVGDPEINTNGDDEIQVSEAEGFTGLFDCRSRNIADMTGLEAFVNLVEIHCDGNQLTILDFSKNTALAVIYCSSNQLTTLDFSKNTALTKLSCFDNQLTTLNVSKNTLLNYLDCGNNPLATLDVSENTTLTFLFCHNNRLSTLDVSKNVALAWLGCEHNQLTSLDVSKNIALYALGCGNNQLTTLDVSKNIALNELSCFDNQLTTLDVSDNTALSDFDCSDNQLTTLDASKNSVLTHLDCYNNDLTILNVRNGNNSNISEFQIQNNPKLTCVTVDDTTYSNTYWLYKDPQTQYSLNCGVMSITSELNVTDMVHLYPNPVSDRLQLDINPIYLSQKLDIAVYDVLGNKILERKNISYVHSLDMSNLSSGIYFIKVYDNEKGIRQMSKVVKE